MCKLALLLSVLAVLILTPSSQHPVFQLGLCLGILRNVGSCENQGSPPPEDSPWTPVALGTFLTPLGGVVSRGQTASEGTVGCRNKVHLRTLAHTLVQVPVRVQASAYSLLGQHLGLKLPE